MTLFPYRKETNQELIAAAEAAYGEAPPDRVTTRSRFARSLNSTARRLPADSLAAQVKRADQRVA